MRLALLPLLLLAAPALAQDPAHDPSCSNVRPAIPPALAGWSQQAPLAAGRDGRGAGVVKVGQAVALRLQPATSVGLVTPSLKAPVPGSYAGLVRFEVAQPGPRAQRDGHPVAGGDAGVRRLAEHLAEAARGQHDRPAVHGADAVVLPLAEDVQRQTGDAPVGRAEEVDRHRVLDDLDLGCALDRGDQGALDLRAGRVTAGGVETPFGRFPAPGAADGCEAEVVIRPQHVRLDFDRRGSGPLPTARDGVAARGRVVRARFVGDQSLVELAMDHGAGPLRATLPGVFLPRVGTPLWATLRRDRCFVFAPAGREVAARASAA